MQINIDWARIRMELIKEVKKLFTYFARKYFTLDLKIWMLKTTQKTSQVSKHFWIEQDFQCKKFCQAIKAWVQCLRQKVICLSHPIGNLLQEKINIIEEVISLKSMGQGTEVKLMQFKQNFQSPSEGMKLMENRSGMTSSKLWREWLHSFMNCTTRFE